jgi:DNA-binding MarR family transcriptional regulator
MNTIRALDHYRMALVRDRVGTLMLSFLAKEGPQTEQKLFEQMSIPHHEGSQEIGVLYRSNFVEHLSERRWNVTLLGRRTLARLGLLDAVNQYYIRQQHLADEDKQFLSCFLSHESDNSVGDELRASLLKSASHIADEYELTKNTFRRYLWATLLSGHENPSNLSTTEYCSALKGTLSPQEGLQEAIRTSQLDWSDQFTFCKRAIADVRKSNAVFMSAAAHVLKSNIVARLVSLTRILSTATSGHADSALKHIYRTNPRGIIFFIDNVADLDTKSASCSFRFLQKEGLVDKSESLEDSIRLLRQRVLKAVEVQEVSQTNLATWDELVNATSFLSARRTLASHPMISQIVQIKIALERGELNSMTDEEAEQLRNALSELNAAVADWIVGRSEIASKRIEE